MVEGLADDLWWFSQSEKTFSHSLWAINWALSLVVGGTHTPSHAYKQTKPTAFTSLFFQVKQQQQATLSRLVAKLVTFQYMQVRKQQHLRERNPGTQALH